MSLYGTRDAAANFQLEVKRLMESVVFRQSKYSPSMYFNKERNLRTLVHGDDFVTVGILKEARWLERKMKDRLEIKSK